MLLALDTATRHISLALHDGQSVTAEFTWHSSDYHTVELAPQISRLLSRAGTEAARLAGVAVALGPGSYTGLRIGLALAKGLALAHSLPLCGVNTFDILMRAQPPRAEKTWAIAQAGRRRILARAFEWAGDGWQPQGEAAVLEWSAFVQRLADELAPRVGVCGEIDALGHEALQKVKERVLIAPPAQALRRAGYLAEIGWERLRAQKMDDPARLAPIYAGQL